MLRLLVIATALLAALASAQNPGFRVLLTNKGLNYVREVAMPILVQELQGLSIPDISGSAGTPVGHIDYDLKNIKAKTVSIPDSTVAVTTSGIKVGISSASIGLGCDWHYREHSWPHVSDHGSADVTASGITVAVVVSVGISANNEPTVKTESCNAGIGHLDIHFHGGASWLYNLFSSVIADSFKHSLNDQLCSIITQEINTEGNKELATLPKTESIDEYAEIDFSLIQAPAMTNDWVETAHKGEFLQIAHNTSHAPFSPVPIPSPTGAQGDMLYAFISAYTAETAGWVYQQAGVLNYNVTNDMIPSGIPVQLNTSFFKPILPNLYKLCPDCLMQLDVAAIDPPVKVAINPSGLNATISTNMTIFAITPNKTLLNAFTLKVGVDAAGKVFVRSSKGQEFVSANLTLLQIHIDQSQSNIGPIPISGLDKFINIFVKEFFLPAINQAISKGFPLPVVAGVSFVNPAIEYGDDYICILTDINYKPSFLKRLKQP